MYKFVSSKKIQYQLLKLDSGKKYQSPALKGEGSDYNIKQCKFIFFRLVKNHRISMRTL